MCKLMFLPVKDSPNNVFLELHDGRRNILHVCAAQCVMASDSKDGKDKSPAGPVADERGTACLARLIRHPSIVPMLSTLLGQHDAFGHTPFMSCVMHGAYRGAVQLLEIALVVLSEVLYYSP
jgi:hypothetical protein